MDVTSQPDRIRELLGTARTVAVVGVSPKPERDSYQIAEYIKGAGYRMIPVNPGQAEILGEKCFPDLRSIPGPVDIVDVFRRPEHAPAIVEEAIGIKAKCVWFQLETTNEEAARKADEAGLLVLRDS